MESRTSRRWAAFRQFLRTRSPYRTVLLLATAATLLLLVVNLTTFFMIQRIADDNAQVDHTQEVRTTAREVLAWVLDAETSQRSFLLTGRADYLTNYERAAEILPERLNALVGLTLDNPEQNARAETIRRLAEERVVVLETAMDMARAGRSADALAVVRRGQGSQLMVQLRDEISVLDTQERNLLRRRTDQSEATSRSTVYINAAAGLLMLILATMSFIILRRFIGELAEARDEVAAANASLEQKVKERTGALSRANEEIQRFAYIVSHDLRAPLVNVMGYTSELEQAGKTIDLQMAKVETAQPDLVEQDALVAVREDVPEAIGFIRASTEKMDRLINAILKLSREGRKTLTPETLDMTGLCQKIADSVQHQTSEADAEIQVADLPTIESDRLAIEQIFGNLIDNAVKYLEKDRPGLISVKGRETAGGWVEYEITDNGRGISDRDHERIFELFRRSGRQDRPGEGLGLAFVRNSVRRLGGTIDIESELGKGSTFRLKFPKRLVLASGEEFQ